MITVGSACVTFEIIEILHSRGFHITEVMREKHFFEPQLLPQAVEPIERTLLEKGIEIIREMEVAEVLGGDHVEGVRLKDGRELPCDLILPFIGVELPVAWLKSAGIATHKGIYTNQFMETNVPDVWAAGDTAENWDSALGETVIMGNWMSARLQGEVAGKNMVSSCRAEARQDARINAEQTRNDAEADCERTAFEQVSFHTSHGFGYQIGWTGDTRPLPDRAIVHVPVEDEVEDHCCILVRHGRIIGGTTVNRPDLMGTITKLIKARVDVSDKLEGLKRGAMELKMLL